MTSKENVDGRSTSSHDNKKFRTRSMAKQRGIAFGFRKTARAVKKKTGQIDRCTRMHRTEISLKKQSYYSYFLNSFSHNLISS